MKRNKTDIKTLLQDILVDAYTDEEQLWAMGQYIADQLVFPVDGFVVGEPISVLEIYYSGNIRQGLIASCRKESGDRYVIAAVDLVFRPDSGESVAMAVYRQWLGLDPFPENASPPNRDKCHKATEGDINMSKPVELSVVSVKEKACRCLVLETKRSITLRTGSLHKAVPGWIVTVDPNKQWSFSGHPYLSGKIVETHLDVSRLGLQPLGLAERGQWDPSTEYWRDEEAPLESWMQAVIAWGERVAHEMEQVLPGINPEDPFSDPILEASESGQVGDAIEARQGFMQLLEADMRCLDAYAHLGNMEFDFFPESAIQYYEAGVRIGELSLEENFIGLLPWGWIDNRPFLRCLRGYGLCLWRLNRFEEAAAVFDRLLWLNPPDNQGVRFVLHDVKTCIPWKADNSD